MNPDTMEVAVRGIVMRLAVTNPRLRVWAERFAEIEPELLDTIDGMPEKAVFFDVGASIGHFSLYAALRRGARVVAFEAEAQNYATLELNHFLNRAALAEPLQSFNVAIADCAGVGRIHTRVYGAGEHVKIMDRPQTQDTREAFEPQHIQTVLKMSLDTLIGSFGLPQPRFLKIDVDGAETAVLAGADATLTNPHLDTVFIELTGALPGRESALLQAHGFQLDAQFPVVRLRGGVYPDLYNCVFRR